MTSSTAEGAGSVAVGSNLDRAIAALRRGLEPRAVAVYGATERLPGRQYVDAVTGSMNHDRVVLVNPSPKAINGLDTRPNAGDSELAGSLDLALIATPLNGVIQSIEDCGRAGIGLASIVTAGFAEAGRGGVELQRRLLQTARDANVRLVGPNSMGLMNVTMGFRAARPFFVGQPGSISIIGQSGVVPSRLMEEVSLLGHGIDLWVTLGNCADIGVPEVVTYLAGRDTTRVIVIYLESVADPASLATALRMAREAGKEVVILKSGRTAAGSVATASHTGAIASPHMFFDLLVKECGVISVDTSREAAEAAAILNTIGRIKGKIALVLGSGGEAALAADLCQENHVPLAAISPAGLEKIRELVPEIGTANPFDLTFAASLRGQTQAIYDIISDEPDVGCIVMLDNGAWPPGSFPPEIEQAQQALDRHVASRVQVIKEVRDHDIAPQRPVRAELVRSGIAATSSSEALWRILPKMVDVTVGDDQAPKRAQPSDGQVTTELRRESELAALDLLAGSGVPVIPYQVVADDAELFLAIAQYGLPVVLKGIYPGISHKTDRGLVHVDLFSEADALEAFRELRAGAAETGGQVVVQPQVRGATAELILGAVNEDRWGPYLMLGAGGIAAEDLSDRVWARVPLDLAEARSLIDRVNVCRAISRRRDRAQQGLHELARLVVAVSEFVDRNRAVLKEIEINPVLLRDEGVTAVDAVLSFSG
jgi:acyl-CoA synthetase (NDP forming)